jgi:hypothetical protein
MLLDRELRWDPAAQRFVDDARADRLVQRQYHGPYCGRQ